MNRMIDVMKMARTSQQAASLAGRTHINAFDLSFALSDLQVDTEELTQFAKDNSDAVFPKGLG